MVRGELSRILKILIIIYEDIGYQHMNSTDYHCPLDIFDDNFLNSYKKVSSHGLVVELEDLQPRCCGFESWRRILDESKYGIEERK